MDRDESSWIRRRRQWLWLFRLYSIVYSFFGLHYELLERQCRGPGGTVNRRRAGLTHRRWVIHSTTVLYVASSKSFATFWANGSGFDSVDELHRWFWATWMIWVFRKCRLLRQRLKCKLSMSRRTAKSCKESSKRWVCWNKVGKLKAGGAFLIFLDDYRQLSGRSYRLTQSFEHTFRWLQLVFISWMHRRSTLQQFWRHLKVLESKRNVLKNTKLIINTKQSQISLCPLRRRFIERRHICQSSQPLDTLMWLI